MAAISKRRETALEVIEGFHSWNIERIMAYRTEDCTQLVVPGTTCHSLLFILSPSFH